MFKLVPDFGYFHVGLLSSVVYQGGNGDRIQGERVLSSTICVNVIINVTCMHKIVLPSIAYIVQDLIISVGGSLDKTDVVRKLLKMLRRQPLEVL